MNQRNCLAIAAISLGLFGCLSEAQDRDSNMYAQPTMAVGRETVPKTLQSMNLVGTPAELIKQALQLYGIDAVIVGPLKGATVPLRLNLSDADLTTTGEVLRAMTGCFFAPVNPHLVMAIKDDKEHRSKYEKIITETIDVPNFDGSNAQSASELSGLLSALFGVVHPTIHGNRVTVRATRSDLFQIEDTLQHLYHPQPEVLLDVKAYLVTHGRNRNVGVQAPGSVTVFNIDTEVENLINSNAAVVNQMISSGLVSAGDTLGIAVALVEGGYGGSSVLTGAFGYFGGGLTATGVQTGAATANMDLYTSLNEQLQDIQLRLVNDQSGKLTLGERYPIMTASTVGIGGSASNGIPSVQYEDLGITLEAKPHMEAGGRIRLHLHETFLSLDGTGVDNIPILDNQDLVSDLSAPTGATTLMVSYLNTSETRTAQGLAGAVTNSQKNLQTSDLVVTITPILVRGMPDTTGR